MSELVLENELPKGWIKTNIGSISKIIHYGYTATSILKNTGTKYLRITDIQNNHVSWDKTPFCKISKEEKKKFLLKENDIVFARTGGTVGKSYLIKQDVPSAVFASYLIRIVLTENTVPKFIHFFFQSADYWRQIQFGKTGLKTNVNAQILSKLVFHLPPLNEQKRIVAKIEELFSKLDSAKQILEKTKMLLKQYRQSLLKSAFEGKLTEKWREENKNKIEPATILLEQIQQENDSKSMKKTDLTVNELILEKNNVLPENWFKITLGEVISPSKEKFKPDNKTDHIFIGLEHIESDTGNIITRGSSKNIKSTKSVFHKNDILYGKLRPYLNKVTIPNFDGVCSTDILVFPKNKYLDSKYVCWFLSTNDFVRFANSTVSGIQHPRTSYEKISSYEFPLSPLNEQKEIIVKIEEGFSLIENNERTIDISLKHIEGLKKSILKQAFEGKLVPQDPNDEPAEVLLQKIKQEKEQLIQKQKSSKRNGK